MRRALLAASNAATQTVQATNWIRCPSTYRHTTKFANVKNHVNGE
jgi:hypothetical protein